MMFLLAIIFGATGAGLYHGGVPQKMKECCRNYGNEGSATLYIDGVPVSTRRLGLIKQLAQDQKQFAQLQDQLDKNEDADLQTAIFASTQDTKNSKPTAAPVPLARRSQLTDVVPASGYLNTPLSPEIAQAHAQQARDFAAAIDRMNARDAQAAKSHVGDKKD